MVSGLPDSYQHDSKPPTDMPCIIQLLCENHEGLVLEAKGIKEHWWKPYIKKLFDKKVGHWNMCGCGFLCVILTYDLFLIQLVR